MNPLPFADLRIIGSDYTVFFDIGNDLIHRGKCKTHIGVSRTVINGNFSALCIVNRGTGEGHIGNEASLLIPVLRRQKKVLAAVFHDGWIVDIQNGSANAINVTIAGSTHTMVEKKPALCCLNRSGTPPIFKDSHHSLLFPMT